MTDATVSTGAQPDEPRPPALGHGRLFLRFLKFGTLAFGGPVAQIAMIRRELVEEESWISPDHFNRLLAVLQVLPGPEAHELCVHLGIRAGGRIGGLLAGLGFMLPGFVLMLLLAWAYTRLGIAGGLIGALFVGVQAAVLAVVLRATFKIGEHILAGVWLWATAIGAVLAMLAGASFWIVLAASGGAYVLASARRYVWVAVLLLLAAGLALWLGWNPAAVAEATRTAPTAGGLFWSGLKAGLLTFGGAYTAIPFIRGDTVGRGWMTDAQFLDGIGLSGMLPAPLVIFSTFVGWISGGLAGALAMTAGMFLPAFAFSLLLYERLELVVEHKSLQRFLAGVAAGVVGLIAFTLLDLARSTADRSPDLLVTVAIFAAALVLVVQWKSKFAPPAAVVLGGVAALLLLGLG